MFLQASVCPQGGVPDQVHPPGTRCTPRIRYTPQNQVHPPTRYTPQTRYPPPPGPGTPPEIRPLLQTVCILLECILVLLPPANEVCEGYVFTGVCLSTPGGACMCGCWGGAWLLGRHVWLLQGGMCGCSGGACVVALGVVGKNMPPLFTV